MARKLLPPASADAGRAQPVHRSFSWPKALQVALAGALALAVVVWTEWSRRAAGDAQLAVEQSVRTRIAVDDTLRRLLDAETAQRGYLLTGRREYLEAYRNADAEVMKTLSVLRTQLGNDPELAATLGELTDRARELLAELAQTIALYDAAEHDQWRTVLFSDHGKTIMDLARAAAESLRSATQGRTDADSVIVTQVLDRGRVVSNATALLALIWLIYFLKSNAALRRAQQLHSEDLTLQRDALKQTVATRTAELRELNEHLQDVREVERSKLARLLHDDLGALLTSAKLDLARLRRMVDSQTPELAERMQHLSATIDEGVELKRRVIEELSPSALQNLGLRAALEMMASDVQKQSGVDVNVEVDDIPMSDSPRIVIYRLVQECLDNLQRHAASTTARVVVRCTESEVLVTVSDAGKGFNPAAIPTTSHGLRKLRHRIEALGGAMIIVSAPGRGTEVEARLPLVIPGRDANHDVVRETA